MSNRFRAFLGVLSFACLACAIAFSEDTLSAPGDDYYFEGRLTVMDARLAPPLREGQVLSGFLTFDLSSEADANAEDADATPDTARFGGPLRNGEFIFDVNHVIAYFGGWREGDTGWITLQRGDANEAASRDAYGLTLPMEGEPVGTEGWEPRWLQIWLMGEAGKWLPNLSLQPPPEKMSTGWFRITWSRADGSEQITAEGPIERFGSDPDALSPSEQIAQLQSVVADLSARLERAEAVNAQLRSDFRLSQDRVQGLNQTIDALLEERRLLQLEVARLEEAATPEPELLARLAELEAKQVLLETEKTELQTRHEASASALAQRDQDLAGARAQIARLEAAVEATQRGETALERPVPDSPYPFLSPGQSRVQEPTTRSRPLTIPPPPESFPPSPSAADASSATSTATLAAESTESRELPRPRKFRFRR